MNRKCVVVCCLLFLLPRVVVAQLCQGSLGDPIVNINFGSGANPGPPLTAAAIGYQYVYNDCPPDGSYTVRNASSACFSSSWHTVTSDHTGNGNGYFMEVNASYQPGDFYVDTIRSLCGATTYEFAAWVMNIQKGGGCSGNSISPDITFKIERLDGTLLQEYNTGAIAHTGSPQWVQYGFFFSTPAAIPGIVIRMRNNAPGGCGNDLLLDDITFRPCGPRLTPAISGITGTTKEWCEGEPTTVTLQCAVSQGFTAPVLQWQQSTNGGATWTDVPGANTATLDRSFSATAAAGSYGYRLTLSGASNIGNASCRVASAPLILRINNRPSATVANNGPFCEGADLHLSASGGVLYEWVGPGGFAASLAEPVRLGLTLRDSGYYYVRVTAPSGCYRLDSTRVVIHQKPVAAVVQDTVLVCQGSGTKIEASGGSHYLWQPATGLTDPAQDTTWAAPGDTTYYTVMVTSEDGCRDSAGVQVNVLPLPVVHAGPDRKLLEGQSVSLAGSISGANYTFLWSPAAFMDNPASLQPIVSPPADMDYVLAATSLAGCGVVSDTVHIRVFKTLEIPNVFTPNGDGINDRWEIPALEAYSSYSLVVVNRYGQPVVKSQNTYQPWDGRYGGRPVPIGTYYYVITIPERDLIVKGWVDVLR